LTPAFDDENVVCRRTVTTHEYLYDTGESNLKRELMYGRLREPAAPYFAYQELVLRIAMLLRKHADSRDLGVVAIAPLDVILDPAANLVVQPDVLFVAKERRPIIRNQVWGAPDLVVEVLSLGTERRDRLDKIALYRQYGVRECWLVDFVETALLIHDFTGPHPSERRARGIDSVRSTVLPELQTSGFGIFS